MESNKSSKMHVKICSKFNLRNLRISLKYRPKILSLILRMRQNIKKKSALLKKLKQQLKSLNSYNNSKQGEIENTSLQTIQVDEKPNKKTNKRTLKDTSTQTENNVLSDNIETVKGQKESPDSGPKDAGWDFSKGDETGKSIADQVKEAAQSALQQTGMVYVESAGMYYDYKTGYYYNTELGLYYHTDTGCYYTYSEDKKEFAFHSYPDRSAVAANASLAAHERRKARKNKKAAREEIEDLTKTLSKDNEDEASKPKRRKKDNKEKKTKAPKEKTKKERIKDVEPHSEKETSNENDTKENTEMEQIENGNEEVKEELEDGECSETGSEKSDGEVSDVDEESDASTSTAGDDDAVAKHHPPCMRVIVRETSLPKLKVGSLFLITKDGGTLGREGDHHTILIRDTNVSRNHLEIRYDMDRRLYVVTDLGSKNGTLLNGVQMSESQEVSQPMEVMHGSTIQLGETKLLCHIHPGNDTCGHCEPGLIMESLEKEKVAYTRTCSVQKQYQLELARLKNKYTPEPLMIEEGTYNDRAKARRETVGSSHHSEKTQTTDVDTFIAPENKGFKLLEKMGWSKGKGLGKDSQGDTEPIPLVSNEGKAGLGTPGSVSAPPTVPLPKVRNKIGGATLRLAAKSKLLQPPAKAFQNPLEDDDDE